MAENKESIRYPIGIQTFSKIIEGGYRYVDKTMYIARLLKEGEYYFLSRPRRFGKSLLLSTLHSFFAGERHLFRNLAIDAEETDRLPSPVFHFDFNAGMYMEPRGLDARLHAILSNFESEWGVVPGSDDFSTRFEILIRTACNRTGRKVVVLVDEYDKPMLGLEENEDLFKRNQGLLKGVFSVLKSMDAYIRFAFLAGVARFNKVSIFSDLNNLRDISFDSDFADICGWSETELTENFREGIESLARRRGETFGETLAVMRDFYDGYRFAPEGSRLYNPFSAMNAMAKGRIGSYWFQTDTPTFLVRKIKNSDVLLPALNSRRTTEDDLMSTGIDSDDMTPLLFQTGYLTIRRAEGRDWELHFPNKEVETGFARYLLPLYMPEASRPDSPSSIRHFKNAIERGEPEDFMKRMETLFKSMPYTHRQEFACQNFLYLLFVLAGADTALETHTSDGRVDMTVGTRNFVYLFEFKFNRSAEAALRQIRERDYAGKYAPDSRKIYLIGANFSDRPDVTKRLTWVIEEMP